MEGKKRCFLGGTGGVGGRRRALWPPDTMAKGESMQAWAVQI